MYQIHNRGDELEILLYDDIGEGWFGGISAKSVVEDIQANADKSKIRVRINSPGGDVFDGMAIHNALKQAEADVTVDVDALAASAASVVAMAGDTVNMAENAMLMIHNAWTIAGGDSIEFSRVAALLEQINGNVALSYQNKTGMAADEVRAMMDAETWMTAAEAEEMGFADAVTSDMAVAAAAFDRQRYRNTPDRFQGGPEKSPQWRSAAAKRQLQLMGVSVINE